MSDDKGDKADPNNALDSETILMTLDQIGQTIDIMTNVVGRLRSYITEQVDSQSTSQAETPPSLFPESNSQTLH